jgi:hypothetical protein
MRPSKYFNDKPLPKYLEPKTVLIYHPHPVQKKIVNRDKKKFRELTNDCFAGYTPLHQCLTLFGSKQTMAMARVLLERGANPNAINRMGHVPLADAVEDNRLEFAKLLLKFGVRLLFRRQSVLRNRDLVSFWPTDPIPRVENDPGPGSGINIPDPQHCRQFPILYPELKMIRVVGILIP